MRVSVVQTKPLYLARDKNLQKIQALVKKTQSRLFVFPELATCGYNFKNKSDLRKVAEPAFLGPTSKVLMELANKKKAAFVVGFPEKYQGHFYNSALIVRPGKMDVYRKIHLFSKEKKLFKAGTKKPQVYQWGKCRFGVMICFDWFFPEIARSLSLKGADLIAHPSNLVMPYAPLGMKIRSLENHVYSITSNRVGREFGLGFIGQSQILGTKGDVLTRFRSLGTGVKTVSIDLKKSRNKMITPLNHIFRDRRPKTYK